MVCKPFVALPICNLQLTVTKPNNRDFPHEQDPSLGAVLKRARLKLKLTQHEAADFMGIKRNRYRYYEGNIHCPEVPDRKRIIDFLGYNFWDDGTNSLSNQLLSYRINKGINATMCGERIGISRNTVKRIETGVKVSKMMILKVESFLNLT